MRKAQTKIQREPPKEYIPLSVKKIVKRVLFDKYLPISGKAGEFLSRYGIKKELDIEREFEKPGNSEIKSIISAIIDEELNKDDL